MGKYNPNVSFDVPVVNLPTAEPIKRTDAGSDITINIPDIAKASQKAQEAALEKQYDAGLNDYARRVNEIAEGHRQGQYDVSTAEMYTRALDDEYLVRGYKASDLYKIRDKFDGGVRAIETDRQKLMVKHEQERRLKYFDSFREEYGMPEATDEEIETITSNVEGLMRDVHKYQAYAGNKELSKEEQDRFKQAADVSAERLSTVEAVMHMYGIVNDPQFHGQQLTPGLKSNVLNQMAKTLQSQGFGYRDAHIIANKVFRDGGFDYAFSEEFKTLKANDEYLKQAISVMKNTTLIDVTSKSPTLKTMLAIGGGDEVLRQFAGSGEGLAMIQQAVGEVANANGKMSTVSLSDAGKATNIIFNNQYQPQTICDIAHTNMCNKAENDVIVPLDTLNAEDLKTDIYNIGQVIKVLEDPKKLARLSEGVKAKNKESIEVLRFAKAAAEGHQFAKDNNDFSRDVAALAESFQQNRLVVDSNGMLRLTQGTEGFLQTAGNFFGYEGTRQQIERVNAALEKLTPAQRAGALMSASGGVIRGWDMEKEKLVNTANRLFSGYIKEGASMLGSFVTGEVLPKIPEHMVGKGVVNTLQKISDADIGFYNEDIHKPNIPAKAPFTGEETSAAGKVSNNATVGGASLVPTDTLSAQALRQYADRLEASVNSIKQSGANTEEGKLERDMQLVQQARALADSLEGFTGEEMQVSSKVSNKSKIAGAHVDEFALAPEQTDTGSEIPLEVEEDVEYAVRPETVETFVTDEYTTKFKSDEDREEFSRWFNAKKEAGEILEEDAGVDYDYVGFYNDPDTDKSLTAETHFPDKYKKPAHDTFSVESIYAKGKDKALAGEWVYGEYVPSEAGANKLFRKKLRLEEQLEQLPKTSKEYKELKKYIKQLDEWISNSYDKRRHEARKRIKERADAKAKKA